MDNKIEPMGPQRSEETYISHEQRHELANIFSIISANAEMIREERGSTESVQRRLERIVTACRRGEGLVRQMRNPENHSELRQEAAPARVLPLPVVMPKRVLVVDDEVDIVEIVSRFLRKEGFNAEGIIDSREALARLQADPFCCDLLITDLDMPGMSGGGSCAANWI